MPHAIIRVERSISELVRMGAYVGKTRALMPLSVDGRGFFITAYEKPDSLVVKIEKTTRPEITDEIKSSVLNVAEKIADFLKGSVVSHNLRETGNRYIRCTRVVEKHGLSGLRVIVPRTPVEVEIGCGDGSFIVDRAVDYPDRFFVGFETSGRAITAIKRRITKSGVNNVAVFHGDAVLFMRLMIPNSVDIVHVNFPEPWFRFRRIKHSLSSIRVAEEVARVLKIGGIFNLRTDNYPTAVASVTAMSETNVFKPVGAFYITVSGGRVGTKFERRWLRKGRLIYSVDLEKCSVYGGSVDLKEVGFPLRLEREFVIDGRVVFKVLGRYMGVGEEIIEVAAGDVLRTQHVFFGFRNGKFYPIPQSIFIMEPLFVKALLLASSRG